MADVADHQRPEDERIDEEERREQEEQEEDANDAVREGAVANLFVERFSNREQRAAYGGRGQIDIGQYRAQGGRGHSSRGGLPLGNCGGDEVAESAKGDMSRSGYVQAPLET